MSPRGNPPHRPGAKRGNERTSARFADYWHHLRCRRHRSAGQPRNHAAYILILPTCIGDWCSSSALLSCGLFIAVWNLVQAAWMKKVAPQSTALYYYIASLCVLAATFFTGFEASLHPLLKFHWGAVNLVYHILLLIGRFSLRSSLEQHYNSVEPMGLSLSGVMTFFFGDYLFPIPSQRHHAAQVRRSPGCPARMSFTRAPWLPISLRCAVAAAACVLLRFPPAAFELLSALPCLLLVAHLLSGLWRNARTCSSAAWQTERGHALECDGGHLFSFCRCLSGAGLLACHEELAFSLAHDPRFPA